MLIYKARCIVDLVVHNNVQILLGVVLRDVGVGEFLVGHCAGGVRKIVVCGGGGDLFRRGSGTWGERRDVDGKSKKS